MAERIDWIALTIFLFFFALVTVMGFFAARWKSGPVNAHLDEWGLGGRWSWYLRSWADMARCSPPPTRLSRQKAATPA